MDEFAEGYGLTKADMEWYGAHYLSSDGERDHPYASVLRADPKGLPPAFVITAECDPLRDDGEADPSAWIVPEAAVIGLDIYNPWSPTNGKEWSSFGSRTEEVAGWFGDTPIVIGEYGCRVDPHNPGLAAEWLRDAAEYARTHNIVSMSYFNSGVNSPQGTWELTRETERAFAELLASDWVARPL
jgi:hypothetical protein